VKEEAIIAKILEAMGKTPFESPIGRAFIQIASTSASCCISRVSVGF